MSALFGSIAQLGYVVDDIDAAMEHWTKLAQVGPFFYFERAPFIDLTYLGQRIDPWVKVAIAQSGPMQIELIQQMDVSPTIYLDFKRKHGTGLQHVAYWSDADQYPRILETALKSGFTIAMSGKTVDSSGPFVYFNEEQHPGTVIELSCVTSAKKVVFDNVAKASIGWDGTNPIRKL